MSKNGTQPVRRMPVITHREDFSGIGYEGFECEIRLNLSLAQENAYWLAVKADDEAASRAALLDWFPSWNFVDETGAEIPHTADGFDLISQHLLTHMMHARFRAVKEAGMTGNFEEPSSPASGNRATRRARQRAASKDGGS